MTVVLSYGMGADSSAILLRWLDEPESFGFDLSELVVVTAQLGSEFERTYQLVERHVLPRLREHGVRWIQASRNGPYQRDGITILDDSRCPERVVRHGPWRLIDELRQVGTVPQVAHGKRLCTHKHKGWVLDQVIAQVIGDRPYTHVLGFNADEESRAERDTSYSSASRSAVYPLIEWGWGRAKIEQWLKEKVGEPWLKSRCGFCPFSACAGSRGAHLEDWRSDPDRGVEALLIEHAALAFNPRMSLYGSERAVDLAVAAGLDEVIERFHQELDRSRYCLYLVRRIWKAGHDDTPRLFGGTTKKGVSWRSVRILGEGTFDEMTEHLRSSARSAGVGTWVGRGSARAVLQAAETTYPTAESMLVVAPAGVSEKERPGFETLWTEVCGTTVDVAC